MIKISMILFLGLYTSTAVFSQTLTIISATCGRCKKQVPTTSIAGQYCVHCGIKWDQEINIRKEERVTNYTNNLILVKDENFKSSVSNYSGSLGDDPLRHTEGIDALMQRLENAKIANPVIPRDAPVVDKAASATAPPAPVQLTKEMLAKIEKDASNAAKAAVDPYAPKYQEVPSGGSNSVSYDHNQTISEPSNQSDLGSPSPITEVPNAQKYSSEHKFESIEEIEASGKEVRKQIFEGALIRNIMIFIGFGLVAWFISSLKKN